jgi:hypothetical protein
MRKGKGNVRESRRGSFYNKTFLKKRGNLVAGEGDEA